MSVKLTLQNLSDWIKDSSTAAKGAVELTLESGLLKDSLEDLVELGGVTGALFKLGSRAIPDPTPEQRIGARLHKAFLAALDYELKEHPIEVGVWKKYLRERLPEVATEKLSGEFTWLSIFGSRGRKPGRSWPIVGELADLGRTWVAEMATAEGRVEPAVWQLADDARGRIHEALAKEVDKLQTDTALQQAMAEALSRVGREALDLLAQELTSLKRYRLFGEIPQDSVYISPMIKVADLQDAREELDWGKIEASPQGDDLLFQAIRDKHPRLVVLEGEMGVGKSCLMRVLASRLAEQFRSDRRHAPIYIRWRDVYNETDLGRAIADQLAAEYGLPFQDLPDQSNLLYLIDGFDEMSSHQEGYVSECFHRLAKLGGRSCSVVVAMRSTVITPGLRLAWKSREALAVQVQEFDDEAVDAWTARWNAQTGAAVTGERLRSLTSSDQEVSHNPLLLYMLAKYVDPVAQEKEEITRTEVFRIFVDETIKGKLRTSREEFPFQFPERDYRLLLQEIAWLASWPKHAPKCPARLIRERIPESFLKDLNFQDIRTAFVLHFFEPGDLAGNEFEFQPEGFRQYLLAEWCVRAQFDAVLDERRPVHALSRTRDQAIDALAQLPLREEERSLLNDLYEELGRMTRVAEAGLPSRLAALGADGKQVDANLVFRLYERVRDDAEEPPDRAWGDEKVGIPEGQKIPPGLDPLRRLFNYWDQCMMATIALFRGLGKNPRQEKAFDHNPGTMGKFLNTWEVIRGMPWSAPLSFADFSLGEVVPKGEVSPNSSLIGADLRGAKLRWAKLHGADLRGADFYVADLTFADLSEADLRSSTLTLAHLAGAFLNGADLTDADLHGVDLRSSDLTDARLAGVQMSSMGFHSFDKYFLRVANLSKARLNRADLRGANLREADLSKADLSEAKLTEADLRNANLAGANLTGADLTDASLTGADLTSANLTGALVTDDQLKTTRGRPFRLPNGSIPVGRS